MRDSSSLTPIPLLTLLTSCLLTPLPAKPLPSATFHPPSAAHLHLSFPLACLLAFYAQVDAKHVELHLDAGLSLFPCVHDVVLSLELNQRLNHQLLSQYPH